MSQSKLIYLPPDCLIEIFHYLPFLPSVLNLQLLSSTFKNTIQHFINQGGFDLNLSFLPSHTSLSRFVQIISRFHRAKQITLCNMKISVDLMKVLSFTSIETLALCNCSTEWAVPFCPELVSLEFKQFKEFQKDMNEKIGERLPFINLKRVIVMDSSNCLNFVWNENFIEEERDETCQVGLKSFKTMESGFDNCWKFKSIPLDSARRVSFLALKLYSSELTTEKFITIKSGKIIINIPIQSIDTIEEKKTIISRFGLKNHYRKSEYKSKSLKDALEDFQVGIYSFRALEDLLIGVSKIAPSHHLPINFMNTVGFHAEVIYFLHKYQVLREDMKIPIRILQRAKALDNYWAILIKNTEAEDPVSTIKTDNIDEEIAVPFSWVHLLKKGQYVHLSQAVEYQDEYESEFKIERIVPEAKKRLNIRNILRGNSNQ